ncbi:Variant surface glycoprotein [Trypanosoma congolense IL3000]|uniref:Variant surface glycoprotein n=1 Tax=Trypanosoma congolense (strain IL3000) TaxID=1068625 RepID=F9WG45_TRYCI|nr:Variant surface glycoprotein [Trypanosoma congolense IL3000]
MKEFWVMLIVGVICMVNGDLREDHNKDEHDRLCRLLRTAVFYWKNKQGELSKGLQRALNLTIFGRESGGSLGNLKVKLPDVYGREPTENRTQWCGEPPNGTVRNDIPRWPGYSAPHDLLCLCTPGDQGWPLNDNEHASEKLCGQRREALHTESSEGWDSSGHGIDQIYATWNKITKPWLEDVGIEENLKDALKNFTSKLVRRSDKYGYKLGQGTPDGQNVCTGQRPYDLCAMYYNNTSPKPWWSEVEEALNEEHKQRAQEAQAHALSLNRNATVVGQNYTFNITNVTGDLNRTRSTSITTPVSWLPGAVLLI